MALEKYQHLFSKKEKMFLTAFKCKLSQICFPLRSPATIKMHSALQLKCKAFTCWIVIFKTVWCEMKTSMKVHEEKYIWLAWAEEALPIIPMGFLPSTGHLTSNSWGRQGNNNFRAARWKQKSETHFLWKMLFMYFYVLFSSDSWVPWQHLHLPDGFHGDLLGQDLKERSHVH